MPTTVQDVQRQEREALLGEYCTSHVPPYAAIPAIVDLTNTPSALRAKHPLSIQPLAGADPLKGFVQICPSLAYKFLWLPPDDDAYRAKYISFLGTFHGIATMPTGFDVDHLFNRARATASGLSFVRMVLLAPGENRSHGAGYESARTKGGIGLSCRQRGIDEIMLMKLLGVPSPRKNQPLSSDMLAHIARIAAIFGLPPMEIERNIRELMEVAAFRSQDDA